LEKKIALLGNMVFRLNRDLSDWAEQNERLSKRTGEAVEGLRVHADKTRQLLLEQKEAVEQIADLMGDGKRESSQQARSRGNLLRLLRLRSS
jgi:hypothetical protein